MTTDDILRMAREAGLMMRDEPMHGVAHFATLVAAAEREACARVCESIATETYGMTNLREYGECARAIRARGQTSIQEPDDGNPSF